MYRKKTDEDVAMRAWRMEVNEHRKIGKTKNLSGKMLYNKI